MRTLFARSSAPARAGPANTAGCWKAATGVAFHLDHVLPRSRRGTTSLANLALSCPGCNMAKAHHVSGFDNSGVEHPLFNPRNYAPWTLGWHLHFELERATGRILTKTRSGEATVNMLDMNATQRAFARKLQIDAGLIG